MHANMPGSALDVLLHSLAWLLNGEYHQRAHTLFEVILPCFCTQKPIIAIINAVSKQEFHRGLPRQLSQVSQGCKSFCLCEAELGGEDALGVLQPVSQWGLQSCAVQKERAGAEWCCRPEDWASWFYIREFRNKKYPNTTRYSFGETI